MIASLWGWLYETETVEPPLRQRHKQHLQQWVPAFDKVMTPFGPALKKVVAATPDAETYLTPEVLTEIKFSFFIKVILLLLRTVIRLGWRRLVGSATAAETAEWNSYVETARKPREGPLSDSEYKTFSRHFWGVLLYSTLAGTTEAILVGRLGKILFVLGLVMWNLARVASLMAIHGGHG
jgi:hypothetical protein